MRIEKFLFSDPVMMLLKRNLDAQSRQIEAIASNLANIDTPGYQAVKVDFEKVYQGEMNRTNPGLLTVTHPRHMGGGAQEGSPVPLIEREQKSGKVDQNNVELDRELSGLALAQLQYSASATAMAKKGSLLTAALESRF